MSPEDLPSEDRVSLHEAFVAALRAVKKRHRGANFAPQTVEAFAWKRFVANGKPDQEFAEFLLVQEALFFAEARKRSKRKYTKKKEA